MNAPFFPSTTLQPFRPMRRFSSSSTEIEKRSLVPMTENPSSENCTEIITDESITNESIPPKSPEKARAGRKSRKAHTVLDDGQMAELIRQNVATLGDAHGWGRDDKNAVYKLAMEFYQPRDCGGSPPRHTTRGINGLFRRLSEYGRGNAQAVRGLLNEAIERGWTSVYPEKGGGRPLPAPGSGALEGLGESW